MLFNERDTRKALYKKYKRGINITDSVDTVLISTSVILAGVGLTVPIMLPLEIAAVVCGGLGFVLNLLDVNYIQNHRNIMRLKPSLIVS